MVSSAAQWLWDTSSATAVVSGYPQGNGAFAPTKTGLLPTDLRNFVGVPIQIYGNPPTPIDDPQLIGWIRWAEDWVEQETSLLLCQSWVAAPPAVTPALVKAVGITPAFSGGYQVQGYDYDLEDAAYDFFFPRAQDEGWMIYSLRYRPVKAVNYSASTPTAIQQISYVYPLLNEYFRVPPSWQVEDHDAGLVRLVPAANVQMLPLFAMQLAFMGFAESVPGGIWMQYLAGLTRADYASRFSFVQRLVLAEAAVQALGTIQGTINLGAESYGLNVDGLVYQTKFPKEGPYNGLIRNFTKQRDALLGTARDKVSGPMITVF